MADPIDPIGSATSTGTSRAQPAVGAVETAQAGTAVNAGDDEKRGKMIQILYMQGMALMAKHMPDMNEIDPDEDQVIGNLMSPGDMLASGLNMVAERRSKELNSSGGSA